MASWKILLIVLLCTAVAGSLAGVIIGKIIANKNDGSKKSFLTVREKIIYASCIAVGLAFILVGVFAKPTGFGGAQETDEIDSGDLAGAAYDGDTAEGDAITDGVMRDEEDPAEDDAPAEEGGGSQEDTADDAAQNPDTEPVVAVARLNSIANLF